MARNLKRDVQAQQLRNYLLFAVSVAIIATMVMGFVLQRRAHTQLGAQKRELEGRIAELRRQANFQTILLAQRSSPMELVRRAESLGLAKITMGQRLFVPLPSVQKRAQTLTNAAPTGTAQAPGQFASVIPR